MPTASFTHSASATAAPSQVWESLQRASTWMGLGVMDEVTHETVRDGRLVSFDWVASVGSTRHKGTARVTLAEPGTRMVLALKSSEVEGELEVSMRGVGSSSALDVTLTARPRGFLGSMFWGRIADALGRGLPARVEEFAAGF